MTARRYSEEWWAEPGRAIASVRCRAQRSNGSGQCQRPAIAGAVVCRKHGGAAGQVKRRAAERILMAQDDAASKLVQWMNDESVDIKVRVQVAQDLLNRGGLGGKTEISVELKPWEQLMQDAICELVYDLDDEPVIKGEVVSDPLAAIQATVDQEARDATPDAEIIPLNLNPRIPMHLRERR